MDLPSEADLLAQPTRARLFTALQELRRPATSEELAGEVGMHVNGVRRHLELMQGGGLLERRRSRHGRGRPRDEWTISAGARPGGEPPEAYADVARWLARAIPVGPERLRQVEATGREIGREIAPDRSGDLEEDFRQTFVALGFQPTVEVGDDGRIACELCNCPYRESVRENPDVICTLHRGITVGVLEQLDPGARLTGFEPHNPDLAGCKVEISRS